MTTLTHNPALSPISAQAQDVMSLIGRVLIALLFIPAGWGKLTGFAGVAGYIASKGVPLPEVCAALAIAIELGLGLLLVLGWQTRWAALGLVVFVAVITPIFHGFWAVPETQATVQKLFFFKNWAVVGGLLFIAVHGPGRLSLDKA